MLEMAKMLMNSTGEFVSKSIPNETNRRFYDAEIEQLRAYLKQATDLSSCRVFFETRRTVNEQRKYPFTFFTSPRDYTLLATDHALDIVRCLEKRFVTGDERVHFVKKAL